LAQQHTTFAHDKKGGRGRTCLAGDFEDFLDHFGAPAATIASALLLSSSSAESLTTNAIMHSLPAPGSASGLLFVLMPVGRGEGEPPLPLDGPRSFILCDDSSCYCHGDPSCPSSSPTDFADDHGFLKNEAHILLQGQKTCYTPEFHL